MACIDYKKAYDVAPQSWIIDFLKMYKITDKVLKFNEETTLEWNWQEEKISLRWKSRHGSSREMLYYYNYL